MNRLFQSFDKENFGEFKILKHSTLEFGGVKILAHDICFPKFIKVFPARILRYTVVIYVAAIAVYACVFSPYTSLFTENLFSLMHSGAMSWR